MHFGIFRRFFTSVALIIAALQLTGCAVNAPITASPKLLKENPINKIAVLGHGRVVWPRMFQREPVLGLEASKETLVAAVPIVKGELISLGYEVPYAEPVAVGFKNPSYKEHWVFPAEGELNVDPADKKEGDSSVPATAVSTRSFGEPYQITDGKPAYVYPKFSSNLPLVESTRSLFETLDNTVSFSGYQIPETILSSLRPEIGTADTLCLARVGGERFTRARKAGALAMNALTVLFGVVVIPPADASRVVLTCYETATGTYLWSNVAGLGDPEQPNGASLKQVLNYFPKKGETLSPQCVMDEDKQTQLSCKRRDTDKPNTRAIASAAEPAIAAGK